MTAVDQVLARARSALGRRTLYWLGAGGQDPRAPAPSSKVAVAAARTGSTPAKRAELAPLAAAMGIDVHDPQLVMDACDCSGFVCWALGFSRTAPAPASYTSGDGSIYTDSIWHDAKGPGMRFERMESARPGALVVYPASVGETYGHVAIVVESDAQGRATQIVHCAKANVFARRSLEQPAGPGPPLPPPRRLVERARGSANGHSESHTANRRRSARG